MLNELLTKGYETFYQRKGAGLSMATACDLIYAGEKAKFAIPFQNVGLVPDCGASFLLARLIGIQKAKELAFTARTVDAAEALKIGLVVNMFPFVSELEEVKLLANQINQGPPKAMAMTSLPNGVRANIKFSLQFLDGSLEVKKKMLIGEQYQMLLQSLNIGNQNGSGLNRHQ